MSFIDNAMLYLLLYSLIRNCFHTFRNIICTRMIYIQGPTTTLMLVIAAHANKLYMVDLSLAY